MVLKVCYYEYPAVFYKASSPVVPPPSSTRLPSPTTTQSPVWFAQDVVRPTSSLPTPVTLAGQLLLDKLHQALFAGHAIRSSGGCNTLMEAVYSTSFGKVHAGPRIPLRSASLSAV